MAFLLRIVVSLAVIPLQPENITERRIGKVIIVTMGIVRDSVSRESFDHFIIKNWLKRVIFWLIWLLWYFIFVEWGQLNRTFLVQNNKVVMSYNCNNISLYSIGVISKRKVLIITLNLNATILKIFFFMSIECKICDYFQWPETCEQQLSD